MSTNRRVSKCLGGVIETFVEKNVEIVLPVLMMGVSSDHLFKPTPSGTKVLFILLSE